MTHLVGLCGALRKDSTNLKLLREAARVFDAESFTQGDLDLPLYNGDVEAAGMPEKVVALTALIASADAVIIACPEYNKALSGVMKNALDWISRHDMACLRDKPVAIMSAAAGRAGGERSQFSLRLCLTPFRPRLVPGPELMIAESGKAFDETGRLLSDRSLKTLGDLMAELKREIARA